MVKLVIFDLDGTLLNTLKDLNNALNYTLTSFNLPNVTINQTQNFIGNGVKVLIKRASQGKEIDNEKAYNTFKDYYRSHLCDETFIYDGIIELLSFIKQNGIKVAVASNKYQEGVDILINSLLKEYVDICVGSGENMKTKPCPDMVDYILNKLNVSNKDCLYVGDSDVDIQTGINCNIKTIGVTWGYKEKEVILKEGPTYIVDDPKEIKEIIKKENIYD